MSHCRLSSGKLLASVVLFGAACVAAAPSGAAEVELFRYFQESSMTIPRADEPYRLLLDGKHSESGVTDKDGRVISHHRHPGVREEYVMQLFRAGTYSILALANGKLDPYPVREWQLGPEWKQSCGLERPQCKGKGFYWLQLSGVAASFAGEPYWLRVGGKTFSGQVDEDGYVFAPYDHPPPRLALQIGLCAGNWLQLDVVPGSLESGIAAPTADRVEEQAAAARPCRASKLARYAEAHADRNHGMPYVFADWSLGLTPADLVRQAAAAQRAALDRYAALAKANDDNLSWLGPLPRVWSEEDYAHRLSSLYDAIRDDFHSDRASFEPNRFKCLSPREVGPVPMMEAVEQYLLGFPQSMQDPIAVEHLYAAGKAGNWLAVAQIFSREMQSGRREDAHIVDFRLLQLMEWLQSRKIGGLYQEYGYLIGGASDDANIISIYAALHQSYPAQYQVGKALLRGHDETLRPIGRRMVTCAENASPAYAKLLRR